MGAFAYVVLLVLDDDVILIYINVVLPMVWVDSPKFFCIFSEILTDVANALVDADLPVLAYVEISTLPATEPSPPTPHQASPISTTIWMTSSPWCRGGAERQHQVFESTARAIRWILPSLPREAKDSVSAKKLLDGMRD